jgi:hypothetical protein
LTYIARKVATGNVENDDVSAQETDKAVEAEHVNDKDLNKDLNDADKALAEGAREVEDFRDDTRKDENNDDSVSYEMQFDAPNCKKKDAKLVIRKDGGQYKALKTFVVKIKNTLG